MFTFPRKFRFTALLTLAIGMSTGAVHALSLEKLLMPGAVSEAHAEFEDDCDQCHTGSKTSDQTRMCLSCHDHEDVALDIRNRTGFHGKSPRAGKLPCRQCHREHLGRSADIVLLDTGSFDHTLTDFELRGAHAGVNCESCHEADAKYRDAPGQCIDCHKRDDHHRGRLGEKCGDCHSENQWLDARFDHDKTDFPLRGEHREVRCELCHANQRYEDIDTGCKACHQTQDVHRGRNGNDCRNCHNPESWKAIDFDHATTDFPLEGRHRKVSCRTCHRATLYQEELSTQCIDCHRSDDAHKGRNGTKCKDCHSPEKWSSARFDHDKDTKFPLRGRHQQLTCESCHVENAYRKKLDAECYACHREDDVHAGQEGESCGDCHRERGWGDDVFFEHDLTAFPLIGLHATTSCEQCHLTATFKDTESLCIDCHADDDSHKKRLGTGCDLCHNPNDWLLWLFDHNAQTGFNIDGAHTELRCLSCHRAPTEARKPTLRSTCAGCHKTDDVHRGRFGATCERCHTTKTFRGAVLQ